MTKKEELRNDILINMRVYLDANTFSILDNTLVKALYNVDVIDMETLPATREVSNDYIWELYLTRKGPRLSPNTIEGYRTAIFEFSHYMNKSFLHIQENDVEYYLLLKKKEGNSNVSLNNKRRKLSSFFGWMRKCHLISENPVENIEQFPEIEKPIDHMTAIEFEQLKTGCTKPRDRALIEFLRCTAMRGGEIPILTIGQVNWHTGTLSIYGQKGHAHRLVCLDEVALTYLRIYLESRGESIHSSNPLFTHDKGNRTKALGKCGIRESVKDIAKRASLQRNVYPHLFRKTTATNIVKRGGSDAEAGEYLGHKPASVTGRHYTYRGEERIIDIFKKFVEDV